MKKIFVFCSLLFLLPFSAKATNIGIDYVDNVYSNRPVGNEILSDIHGYLYADESLVYCLDPSLLISLGEGKYQLDESYLDKNLSKEEIDYISLIAHFGYEFNRHQHDYYYMAAQELIWEKIYDGDFYWTDQEYPNGNLINIDKYKEEIIYLIDNRPFLNQNTKGLVNEEIILEDKSDTLKYYDIVPNENLDIKKIDNKLYIKTNKSGTFKVKLEHKSTNNKKNLVYSAANHQTVASLGNDILLESEFEVTIEEIPTEPKIIEDVLPNTKNTNVNKNISCLFLLCLGLFCLKRN